MKTGKVRERQIPIESVYPMTITSGYKFMRTDYFFLFFSNIVYFLFYLFIGIGYFKIIGKHKVYGRNNIRSLKRQGFITVANHCHYFDTVLTGVALLPRQPWYAAVQQNFETPYYRKWFRILRGFPIPDGVLGLKKIMTPVVEAVSDGKIVHLFPEKELWHLHQDIDNFQNGAFYLAHHANCPVIPIIHIFKPRTFFGKKLSKNILVIKTIIGEPIFPRVIKKEGKSVDRASIQEMTDRAYQWMKTKIDEHHKDYKKITR